MLDLHGYTVHQGWQVFKEAVDNAKGKSLTVITGRGQMNREFRTWAENHPKVKFCEEYPQGGQWNVRLKKKS